MRAWRLYRKALNETEMTLLRCGLKQQGFPTMSDEATAGAELTYYKKVYADGAANAAITNLLRRAARNEAEGKFLDNAARWRRAAMLIHR